MIDPRTVMIYAESGVGKSTEVYQLVRYLLGKWKKEGSNKTVRLVNTDGGGSMTYFRDSGLEAKGYVDGIDISSSNIIQLEAQVIAEGRWPDQNGYLGPETNWYDVDEKWISEHIGAYIFEGFDSMANRWKGHMSKKDGSAGFKHSWGYEEESDSLGRYYVGGLDKGHYGIVQSELDVWWNKLARRLPVEYIICTSLVAIGKDRANRPVYGPSSIGKAQAGQIPQWFQYTFHLEKRKMTDAKGNEVDARIAWYENHVDELVDCEYIANVRTLPEHLEERDKLFPGGFIQLIPGKRGIVDYFKWKDGKGLND